MRKTIRKIIPAGALMLTVLTMSPAQAEFIDTSISEISGLGDLPGGAFQSVGYAISGDGTTVVGSSTGVNGTEAFRWTSSGGILGLGGAEGVFVTQANGVSDNGNIIVGYRMDPGPEDTEAIRWTASGEMLGLGYLPGGNDSQAWGISGDGAVIVGWSNSTNGASEAFRWTADGGMVGLGDLTGGIFHSSASATSANGSVIVGTGRSASGTEAFRWTTSDGMVGLGDLAGGTFLSTGNDVSADGSVTVGYSNSANGGEAFRWTATSGMVGLGDLAGGSFYSTASGVSAHGEVIVGQGSDASGPQAFYWTEATGMQSVESILSAAGVDTSGWILASANDVSDDGTIIVGFGGNPSGDTEAYLAKISPTQTGLISIRDFQASVDEIGVGQQLMGHVHRQLAGQTLPTMRLQQGFAASPFMSYSKGSESVSGGVAVGWQLDGITLTGKIGAVTAEDDVRYGGETSFDGFWYSAGIATQLGDLTGASWLQGLELSVAVQASDNDAEIDRKYFNGSTLETSEGDTDLTSLTYVGRVGWRFKMSDTLSLTPYYQVLHNETKTDDYMETGGTFPGMVHDQRDTATENSFGTSLGWQLSKTIGVNLWAAWVDMHNESGSDITIDVTGIGTFTSPGIDYDESWADFGLSTNWNLTDSMALTAEVGGTDGSNYPEDWHGSVGLSYLF